MANSMVDESSFINEESDNNIFNRSDNTAVANSDVEINNVNKLKTEIMALKIIVTEQLYIKKQAVGSPKTSMCNCSSKNNIYIDSLHDQINYLREENKLKNSSIQSLLCHSPSTNVYNYNDKGDNSSPISEKAENDNLNNNLDNLFDKVVDDNYVDTKEDDHEKDEDSSKPLEHQNVTTRKKKKKNHSEELDNCDNNNNKHDKNSNHDRIDNNNKSTSSSNSKETVFILGDRMAKKVNVFYLTKNIEHKFLVKVRPFSSAKTRCMYDHAKPTIRELNPKHIILHVGTNDLNSEKTASQI